MGGFITAESAAWKMADRNLIKQFGPETRGLRAKLAVGARRALLPLHTLGALAFAGRVLPDATPRGMRMFRSHGGTVPIVSNQDLLSEASSPGSAASCRKPHARQGADTPAIFSFVSAPLPRGRHPLLADRWPRVTGLTSCLSGCICFCSGVTWFFTPLRRRLTDFATSAHSPRSRRPFAPSSFKPGLLAGLVPDNATAFWFSQ
jgi:hypothetical protein